ncbi:MAG: hypothetical protein KTR24_08870 [Saprospiraceae bacterium]|nr:hypothetical protein [Saprospiraceae bacterium]
MRAQYRKYDKLIVGILAGLVVPIIWYFLLLSVYEVLEQEGIIPDISSLGDFRQRTSALVAICFNILILQIFRVRYMYRAMQGVVFPTIALVGVWLYFFGSSVL